MEPLKKFISLIVKRPATAIILVLSIIILILIITWKWPDLYNTTNEIRKRVLEVTEQNNKTVDKVIASYQNTIENTKKKIDANDAEMLRLASVVANSKIEAEQNRNKILELQQANKNLQGIIDTQNDIIAKLTNELAEANKKIAFLENKPESEVNKMLPKAQADSAKYSVLLKTDSLRSVEFSFDNIKKINSNKILISGKVIRWNKLSAELKSGSFLTLEIRKIDASANTGSKLVPMVGSDQYTSSIDESKLITFDFEDQLDSSPFKGHKNINANGNGYEFSVVLNSLVYGQIVIGTFRVYFNPLIE